MLTTSQVQEKHSVPKGPPYASQTAALGGIPTVSLDVPITSVFLALFALGAISHMTIFQINRKSGHKFIMSGAMFGFCMARIIACSLRIVWAAKPTNVSVEIAASLFVSVGDIIGFVVNLNLAQRIIRAHHPNFGWHSWLKIAFITMYAVFGLSIILLVSFTVWSYFILDPAKLIIARDVDLFGATYFATAAFLPIPMVLCARFLSSKTPAENFGTGTIRSKVIIVLYGSFLLALGTWFRAGTAYPKARPVDDPASYQSKACFYVFYFTLEILVIWTYLLVRIDRRFYVSDGSKGPGDYSRSMARNTDKEKIEEPAIGMEMANTDCLTERETTSEDRTLREDPVSKEHTTEVENESQVHILSHAAPRTHEIEGGCEGTRVANASRAASEMENASRVPTASEIVQHDQ